MTLGPPLLPCLPLPSLLPPGESYAGHYVPAVASGVYHASKSGELSPPVNLQGLAIGNGLTDPAIQYGASMFGGGAPAAAPLARSMAP